MRIEAASAIGEDLIAVWRQRERACDGCLPPSGRLLIVCMFAERDEPGPVGTQGFLSTQTAIPSPQTSVGREDGRS
jgi:hypothetical protein